MTTPGFNVKRNGCLECFKISLCKVIEIDGGDRDNKREIVAVIGCGFLSRCGFLGAKMAMQSSEMIDEKNKFKKNAKRGKPQ